MIGTLFQDHWAQAGLVDGYWSTDVKYLKLEPGFEYSFTLTRQVMKRLKLHQECFEHSEIMAKDYNYFRCIDNVTQNLLKKKLETDGHKLCWIPQSDYFIRLMNLTSIEACQTTAEMEAVSFALTHAMSKGSYSKECTPPCSYPNVNIKTAETVLYQPGMESMSELYLQWNDNFVSMQEEYLLMDFNAILSAIGGSLGLFLGFSCLQFLLMLLQKFEETF